MVVHKSSHACDCRRAWEDGFEVGENAVEVVPSGMNLEGGVYEEEEEGGDLR